MKVIKHKDKWYLQSQTGYKEILLSTDDLLIQNGVQPIDDEFLEWFVKNPSCEKVKVNLIPINEFGSEITVSGYGFSKFIYKIIIPKEEPKQKSLEEVAESYVKNSSHELYDLRKQSFIEGAKWQVERMYSREELESYLFQLAEHYAMTSTKSDIEDFNNWIEQNL